VDEPRLSSIVDAFVEGTLRARSGY